MNAFIDEDLKEYTGKNCTMTGLIPIGVSGDVFHIRGVDIVTWQSNRHSGFSTFYDVDGNCLAGHVETALVATVSNDENGDFTIAYKHTSSRFPTGTAYVRFNVGTINGEFIITRNELIPLE